jgi:hypothetical protein
VCVCVCVCVYADSAYKPSAQLLMLVHTSEILLVPIDTHDLYIPALHLVKE